MVSDGGQHQIENPHPDTVLFWYDPSIDYIVQEEVEPYDVRGFFIQETQPTNPWSGRRPVQYSRSDTSLTSQPNIVSSIPRVPQLQSEVFNAYGGVQISM